jgi:hypothetical protein
MSVDWELVYSELKGWQTGIGSLAGFVALMTAALFNARLNRKRDERLRSEEVITVASALYGEIVILRQAVARMANAVGSRYMDHGLGTFRGEPFDQHFVEGIALPPLRLYPSLSEKVGILPSDVALEIVRFYARVEEAQTWLPRLREDAERPFTYSVSYVLDPAIDAVQGVLPALRAIERFARIGEPAGTPNIEHALQAQEIDHLHHEP